MNSKYAIYIPNFNGEKYLKAVNIPSNVVCVVMDNCSTDNSKAVAQNRGFEFIENEENIGRIGNWCRCVEHFRGSSYEWMKWLFVGDTLSTDFTKIITNAIRDYPEAAMILFDYRIIYQRKTIVKTLDSLETGYVNYECALRNILEKGNIFGAPLGILLSKKANLASVSLESIEMYPWAGDMYLAYVLMKEKRIAYSPNIIGSFQTDLRKNYSANRMNVLSTIEELEINRKIFIDNVDLMNEKKMLDMMKHFLLMKMRLCNENNAETWRDVINMQTSVIKGLAKMLRRRIE